MEDPFSKLLDLLKQLAGMRACRRREIFEKLLVPIYDKLGEIHSGYMKLFRDTRAACPELQANGHWTCVRDGQTVTLTRQAAVNEVILRLKNDFPAHRDDIVPDRIFVRTHALEYLSAGVGKKQKRFLWSILLYLLYPEKSIGTVKGMDLEIQAFLRGRNIKNYVSTSWLETPSSKLFGKIKPLSKADDIYDAIELCEQHLMTRWTEINKLSAQVQMSVVSSTTPPNK